MDGWDTNGYVWRASTTKRWRPELPTRSPRPRPLRRSHAPCSSTRHPDRRRRHQGRASCEVAGGRFEAEGPAPIYKLTTLLWLHGHGGADFEVWDDVSPTGKPGGLAMRGQVRNWARLVKGKPGFNRQARLP